VWDEWNESNVCINGLGNLMLWQYDQNRSVKNESFEKKRSWYASCGLSVAAKVAAHPESAWKPDAAAKKLDGDSKLLANYLFVTT
jgi:hypothetical protein